MDEAKVSDTKPMVMDLEPGTYWWCACGRSEGQPFCDGSHRGTGLSPVEFKVEEAVTKAICMCKQTETQPQCDGSHGRL